MEIDLKDVVIKSYTHGNKPKEWHASIEYLFFRRQDCKAKEDFYIGSLSVYKTYSEAVLGFKTKLEQGMLTTPRGTLRYDGHKFYMQYKEGFSAPISDELSKLDKYKEDLQHKRKCNDPSYINELKKKLEEKKEQEEMVAFIKRDTSKAKVGKVIADPICEEVMELIGLTVEGSNSYGFNESVLGALVDSKTSDDKPFKVSVDGQIVACSFIRSYEKRIEPYSLSNPEVRRKLFGRLYKTKDGSVESCVNLFTCVDGWKVNGMSAQKFLTDCVWLDNGQPCGETGEE